MADTVHPTNYEVQTQLYGKPKLDALLLKQHQDTEHRSFAVNLWPPETENTMKRLPARVDLVIDKKTPTRTVA